MIRLLLTILSVFALVFGAIWLFSTVEAQPGTVEVEYGGIIWSFTLIEAMLFVLAGVVFVLAAVWLLRVAYTLILFLLGDETAINRFFARSRERRGVNALSQGMTAMAIGDTRTAQRKAKKADRLLNRPEMTKLLAAEAATAAGDPETARAHYRELAANKTTAFVGVRGLMQQAMLLGETDKALGLAQKAHELNPKDPGTLESLYELQSQKFDWEGARKTIQQQRKVSALPAPDADRREAALALAQAQDAGREDNTNLARDYAVQATRLDPANTEAACLAARLLTDAGSRRAASKIVLDSWTRKPDTRLASVYADIEPDESPAARKRRFDKLLEIHPDHPETAYLKSELALGNKDWAGARAALADLRETDPSARTCAIQAAITRGEGGPEHEVRAWLARALSAPRDGVSEEILSHTAMLPLMIGSDDDPADPAPQAKDDSDTDTAGDGPDLTKDKDTPQYAA